MTYIIAEIGNNHNGSVDKAKRLIEVAAKAKVDAVKFQTFTGLDIVSPKVLATEYPGWQVKNFKYWHEFLDTISLPLKSHQEIINFTKELGMDFITTPVSPAIVQFLETLEGIHAYKLASMDLNNWGLMHAMAKTNKPIIMSTGMGELQEVDKAVKIFEHKNLQILHCVSDYPLEPKNAALGNITVLRKRYPGINIGFSDHSLGHELVVAAVTLGATVIEKHITLDRNDPALAEHHFSLEPEELTTMVKWIRAIDDNLKHKEWIRSAKEAEGKKLFRRSFHYKQDFKKGHVFSTEDLTFIRPGEGIDYQSMETLIGKKLKSDKKAFDPCLATDWES